MGTLTCWLNDPLNGLICLSKYINAWLYKKGVSFSTGLFVKQYILYESCDIVFLLNLI